MKTAILVPCYKRPEYTAKCIRALEEAQEYPGCIFYLVDDGSNDGTVDILESSKLNKFIKVNPEPAGLRNVIIDFFDWCKDQPFDFLSKMDNDSMVPERWLNEILSVFAATDVDILSPNVVPSNAAYSYGEADPKCPLYRPSRFVGGLWTMKAALVKDMFFERIPICGVRGAFQILKQIILYNNPKIGWLPQVTVQDVGHWSGNHPDHIKSKAHAEYSCEVGRDFAWTPID